MLHTARIARSSPARRRKAKTEFAEALTGDPDSVEALYWSATVELRLGRRPGAVRLLEKTISVDPDYTSARYELARAYAAEGEAGKAAKQFEEFRRLTSRCRAGTAA